MTRPEHPCAPVCEKNCFECPFEDCIYDGVDAEDCRELSCIEREFIKPVALEDGEKEAYHKTYYKANREKILARNKAYREANKETIRIKKKIYREKNRDKRQAYYEANHERICARQSAYYWANREKILAKQKARYQAKKGSA